MRRYIWMAILGCSAAKSPPANPGPRSEHHVDSTSEAGAVLAAVPIRDGKLEVPNDWHPKYLGMFPALAHFLAEEWTFRDGAHCLYAGYYEDVTTLSAKNASWTPLVTGLKVTKYGWKSAHLHEGDVDLGLTRVECPDCNDWPAKPDGAARVKVILSICNPFEAPSRNAATKTVMSRIASLELHDRLLVEGAIVESLEYQRDGTRDDIVRFQLAGDASACDAWNRFLKEHALIKTPADADVKTPPLESVSPLRVYSSHAVGDDTSLYRLHVLGKAK